LGAAFRVQFVEIATPIYTSNALDCAFAGSMPSLGMSTVTANFHGGPIKTRGRVRTTSAPVIRFNF
jgi:hypothetical protein